MMVLEPGPPDGIAIALIQVFPLRETPASR